MGDDIRRVEYVEADSIGELKDLANVWLGVLSTSRAAPIARIANLDSSGANHAAWVTASGTVLQLGGLAVIIGTDFDLGATLENAIANLQVFVDMAENLAQIPALNAEVGGASDALYIYFDVGAAFNEVEFDSEIVGVTFVDQVAGAEGIGPGTLAGGPVVIPTGGQTVGYRYIQAIEVAYQPT